MQRELDLVLGKELPAGAETKPEAQGISRKNREGREVPGRMGTGKSTYSCGDWSVRCCSRIQKLKAGRAVACLGQPWYSGRVGYMVVWLGTQTGNTGAPGAPSPPPPRVSIPGRATVVPLASVQMVI